MHRGAWRKASWKAVPLLFLFVAGREGVHSARLLDRLGARRVPDGHAFPMTFGGSFWGDNLVLDYAFQSVEGRKNVHRVTMGWR